MTEDLYIAIKEIVESGYDLDRFILQIDDYTKSFPIIATALSICQDTNPINQFNSKTNVRLTSN